MRAPRSSIRFKLAWDGGKLEEGVSGKKGNREKEKEEGGRRRVGVGEEERNQGVRRKDRGLLLFKGAFAS